MPPYRSVLFRYGLLLPIIFYESILHEMIYCRNKHGLITVVTFPRYMARYVVLTDQTRS